MYKPEIQLVLSVSNALYIREDMFFLIMSAFDQEEIYFNDREIIDDDPDVEHIYKIILQPEFAVTTEIAIELCNRIIISVNEQLPAQMRDEIKVVDASLVIAREPV